MQIGDGYEMKIIKIIIGVHGSVIIAMNAFWNEQQNIKQLMEYHQMENIRITI